MKALFDQILKFLEALGHALFASVTRSFEAGIQSVVENGGELLIDAARDAVRAAEESSATGFDKFDVAFDHASARLKSEGLAVVKNAVSIAIENAVAELKQEIAEATKPSDGPSE